MSDFWKNYGAHALGYLLATLPVIQAFAPTTIPGWGGVAGGIAGALLIFIHNVQTAVGQPAVLPPPSTTAKSHWLVALLAALLAFGLISCKTAPTATQQAASAVVVDVAAGLAIQQGTNDPAVWKSRATSFKAIAVSLQSINNSGTATLATLAADLQPLIQKLGPADVLAANALVAALTPYLQQQLGANPTLGATQQQIAVILTEVITACSVYGA